MSEGNGNGRLKISVGMLVQYALYLIAIVLAYAALDARIQVLEVKYDHVYRSLSEIRADVKELLKRP